MISKFLKQYLIVGLFVSLAIFAVSCNDDDEKTDKQEQAGDTDINGNNSTLSLNSSKIVFPKAGGVQTVILKSEQNVLILGQEDWMQVKQISNSNGEITYEITVPKIPTGTTQDRSCELKFVGAEGEANLNIVQSCDDKLTISESQTTLDSKGGVISFSLASVLPFTIDVKSSWIKEVSKDGDVYSFDVKENTGFSNRTGRINITAGSSKIIYIVYQEAGQKLEITSSMSAMDIAKFMYPAWNLGNTMEASGGETSWQSTKTTQQIIDYVAESGFRAVRIPCSWYIHSSKSGEYTIDANWMARVKEIVDYCMNANLFVELNDHWDNGWLEEFGFSMTNGNKYTAMTEEKIAEKVDIMTKLWTQIAETFKDYDNKLMFAGLNEPFQNQDLFNKNLTNKAQTLQPLLERYNQAFVDAVRATGGNNSTRVLVVQAPGADLTDALTYLNMPTDIVANKLMMEGHYYPWPFSFGNKDNAPTAFSGEKDFVELCKKLKAKFCDNGIPVLIGEYGANWTSSAKNQAKHDEAIKTFFKVTSKWGPSYGCLPFAWDTNHTPTDGTENMTIINRAKLSIFCLPAYEGIMEGTEEAVWPY